MALVLTILGHRRSRSAGSCRYGHDDARAESAHPDQGWYPPPDRPSLVPARKRRGAP